MPARHTSRGPVLQWVVVLVVGIIVVTLVLGLNLISRLNAGQNVLNAARPAFTTKSLTTDAAGIEIISKDVDMAAPLVTSAGGGAREVPTIIDFVAAANHISRARALRVLEKQFPHTIALLQGIPLSAVTAELPHLEAFLERTLKVTPAELTAALGANFPALLKTIVYLPKVTSHWYHVPHLTQDGLTNFSGTRVQTVPQLRDYFARLIAVVRGQKSNFDSLDSTSVNWIAWVVLAVGVVVILFALLMIFLSLRGVTRRVAIASGSVVVVVGVAVVALVLALNLIPRLSNGQRLVDALNPAFAAPRVKGDRAGIRMVSNIVKAEDPIMTRAAGAATEVPRLIAFVAAKTHRSQNAVLSTLKTRFSHTTEILLAVPLSSVSAELPGVNKALARALPRVPALAQTVAKAPALTSGWDNVPGTAGAKNFEGGPVSTVPELTAYFGTDVIPVLEKQRQHWVTLTSTSKINFIGWLVLALGAIAIVYGVLMVLIARTRPA
ncbi:MAG: hypothetical protein QOJ25_2932 [Solirubrobacteraceae bacterium]|jgi:hypothetical protein|nr:hypothetical protein [Solirubrobacteraceae bacterium]